VKFRLRRSDHDPRHSSMVWLAGVRRSARDDRHRQPKQPQYGWSPRRRITVTMCASGSRAPTCPAAAAGPGLTRCAATPCRWACNAGPRSSIGSWPTQSVTWEFQIDSREIDELLDVGGSYVHGRPGARFLYLSWGAVDGTEFAMFRRIKLMFADVPTHLLRAAHDGDGVLVGRLGLTDSKGQPRAARVRPPDVVWEVHLPLVT